jgi:hypothetical protein
MHSMFRDSQFNGDISEWNMSSVRDISLMLDGCPLRDNPPKWYKWYKWDRDEE